MNVDFPPKTDAWQVLRNAADDYRTFASMIRYESGIRAVTDAGEYAFKRLRIEINWCVMNVSRQSTEYFGYDLFLRANRCRKINFEENDFWMGTMKAVRATVEACPEDDDLSSAVL